MTGLLENVVRPFPRVLAKETAQLSGAIVSSGTNHGSRTSDGQISCIVAASRRTLTRDEGRLNVWSNVSKTEIGTPRGLNISILDAVHGII